MITTLQELTGEAVTPGDLLRAVTAKELDTGFAEWQAASLMPEVPPYDWGAAAEPEGEPVRHVAGVGFVVGLAGMSGLQIGHVLRIKLPAAWPPATDRSAPAQRWSWAAPIWSGRHGFRA